MDSLTAPGQILLQLQLFTGGMMSMCHDVDVLKEVSLLQCNSWNFLMMDYMTSNLVPPPYGEQE